MNIPTANDLIQEVDGSLATPEIRVWIHPESGDDYYLIFETFKEAEEHIKQNKNTERVPLIAFKGYELNLYAIKERKVKTK